jgi:5-formyltetrahydrofolate cyclo-ligase
VVRRQDDKVFNKAAGKKQISDIIFRTYQSSGHQATVEMLDRLRELCDVVLLPVARTDADGEHPVLQWAEYVPGELVAAALGVREPARASLDPAAVARADIVLVPALAVDRTGVRLGRGGGFYDRALALCAPGTPLVAVVRDDEVLDSLPAESHDVPMTHALTPAGGMITLRGRSDT